MADLNGDVVGLVFIAAAGWCRWGAAVCRRDGAPGFQVGTMGHFRQHSGPVHGRVAAALVRAAAVELNDDLEALP